MAVQTISGIDVTLKVGAIPIGCAQKIDVDIKTDSTTATCRASGGWKESIAGAHSWTASTDGLYRVATGTAVSTNVTANDLVALQIARTVVALSFGSVITGDVVYSGNAIITNVKLNAPESGAATFAVSFEGTGPLTATVNV